MAESKDNIVKTTKRSLAIVDMIQEMEGATLSELVACSGLSKNTIYKHLNTLEQQGYLTKEGEVYHIGLKFYNRGEYARCRKKEYAIATEKTKQLADILDEEAEFVVENDGRGISIYGSYHPRNPYQENVNFPGRTLSHSGTFFHLHSFAAGKAILAKFSDAQIKQIIAQWELPKHTENTITTKDELFDELESIRTRGYALSDEEFANGLRGVGRWVNDPNGSVMGAIAAIVPIYRIQGDTFTEDIPRTVVQIGEELEHELESIYPKIER
jgi:IclR family acetate operon transcriptional repressor